MQPSFYFSSSLQQPSINVCTMAIGQIFICSSISIDQDQVYSNSSPSLFSTFIFFYFTVKSKVYSSARLLDITYRKQRCPFGQQAKIKKFQGRKCTILIYSPISTQPMYVQDFLFEYFVLTFTIAIFSIFTYPSNLQDILDKEGHALMAGKQVLYLCLNCSNRSIYNWMRILNYGGPFMRDGGQYFWIGIFWLILRLYFLCSYLLLWIMSCLIFCEDYCSFFNLNWQPNYTNLIISEEYNIKTPPNLLKYLISFDQNSGTFTKEQQQQFRIIILLLTMNNIKQPNNIPMRNPTRTFGVDITNYSTQQIHQLKATKVNIQKPSLSTPSLSWNKPALQLSPYMEDIKNYSQSQQHQSYISDDFMSWHSDINISMRESLMGWLIQIQPQLKFSQHTLYLATIIIDKFCYHRYVSKNRYHLLGISSLFLAAKYEEVKTPRLKHYISICGGKYTSEQILGMESQILLALNFKILGFTVYKNLQESCEVARLSNQNKELCFYILDLCLVQYKFCLVKPALLCWAIILHVLNMRKCSMSSCVNELIKSSTRSEIEIIETAGLVGKLFDGRQQMKFKQVNQKYWRVNKQIPI